MSIAGMDPRTKCGGRLRNAFLLLRGKSLDAPVQNASELIHCATTSLATPFLPPAIKDQGLKSNFLAVI